MPTVGHAPDLSAVDPATRETFMDLMQRPLTDERTLALHVAQYRELVVHAAASHQFIDVALADRLAEICQALLASVIAETPETKRRVIQAGVRYFIMADDANDDLTSEDGFHDDMHVLNAITSWLERPDLTVAR